jgi:molecular chaperone HscC
MIVGIDLGTTNSLVGVWNDGEANLIPNALGSVLTPSVVGVDERGNVIVGQAARDRLVSHPALTASVFKRHMGTDRQFPLGKKTYRAEELSALVLKSLKADAEAFLGSPLSEAVITVPAYFNDAQRKATKAAGALAGLKVERLLTEPTAAALAYGFVTGGEEETILVVDLGGGTLDVSLLHAFEGIMEVKSTAGDIWLGGEDFTDLIAKTFMVEAGKTAGMPSPEKDLSLWSTIVRKAEIAKRALSDSDSAAISVNFGGKSVDWSISRERFETMTEPLLAKIRLPLERALRDARLAPDAISRIVFAGGASRMPMFKRLISRLFRQLPTQHINPDEVVARGAAVRAGLSARSADLVERVMTDVSPFTLGVETASRRGPDVVLHGIFMPIIERNTIIPASRSQILQTITDNQEEINLRIFQGEARLARDNVQLGNVRVYIPRGPAGQEKVEVRFTYDTSGLLEVDATALSTKRKFRILIEGNPGVLSQEQIAERLKALEKLKIHPRDAAENLAIIARADRLYQENLGDVRVIIGENLNTFMAVLERQDPEEIAQARQQMSAFLDKIDVSILT